MGFSYCRVPDRKTGCDTKVVSVLQAVIDEFIRHNGAICFLAGMHIKAAGKCINVTS